MPWIHAWRRCVTGNQATKVPGDRATGNLLDARLVPGSHGAHGSYDKGRYGYGYPEAPPLEDERGHAPRALETPGGHIGELRSEEHTSELQSHSDLVCRLLLEKKKNESTASRRDVHHQRRASRRQLVAQARR